MTPFIPTTHTKPTNKRDPGARYAKALETHERIERELFRAQNRWQKSRAALKRIEKKLDQGLAVTAADLADMA